MSDHTMEASSRLRAYIKPYRIYLVCIALLGWSAALVGLDQIRSGLATGEFYLLLALSIVAHIGTVSVKMPNRRIGFSVAPAVSMAVMFLYGVWLAALVEVVSMLAWWLIKAKDPSDWRKSVEQLAFNTGMGSIVIVASGSIYWGLRTLLGMDSLVATVVPWFIAGIAFDQINLLLVIIIMKLSNPENDALAIWRGHRWASYLNLGVLTAGGGMLAYAGSQFGWQGILIFFFPVLLSAYAFRLYAAQLQDQMSRLEQIVEQRTGELSTANASLRKLNEEKDLFLAILAHDMRSPLTTIRLYSELIRRAPDRLQQKPEMIDMIVESQDALLSIVDNIVDLERLSAGGSLALQRTRVELIGLLRETVELVHIQAERKNIDIERVGNVSFMEMSLDRQQIGRAVTNLLTNAIKYSTTGSTVQLCVKTSDDGVVVSVCDKGFGIPQDDLPYVFERYRRVSKHRQLAAGTGLGLAITKAIVEAHGGTVAVTSVENEGSTFSMTLPVIKGLQAMREESVQTVTGALKDLE